MPHLQHAERPSKMLTCGPRNVVIGQAQAHSNRPGAPRASRPFFLFIHRLQAQAPRSSRPLCVKFFLFFNRLQAQASRNTAANLVRLRDFFY